ncbi:MAG: hypothetical protein WC329_05815 [Candidatus Omnitrophota bacterium]|jgi:hypothetical protein
MSILAIDPSSTAIGWAVLDDRTISESGIEKPKGDTREEKIISICKIADRLFTKYRTDYAAIEIPAVHTHGRIAKAQGQAIYGMAVGIIIGCAYGIGWPEYTLLFLDPSWKNRQPKEAFAVKAKVYKPNYDRMKDKGFDEADAICLAHYAAQTLKVKGLCNGN